MAKHILVKGIVQGVGFRPYIYGLATRYHLHGWVCNTSGGMEILVEGDREDLEGFIRSLPLEKPLLARIDSLEVSEAPSIVSLDFEMMIDPGSRSEAMVSISMARP